MKIKLNIKDRMNIINGFLPSQGSILEQTIVKEIMEQIKITPDERAKFNIKQVGSQITWDSDKDSDVEYDISKERMKILKGEVTKADSEKRISQANLDTAVKIQEAS